MTDESKEYMPKLRFPEFRKADRWDYALGGNVFSNAVEKNSQNLPLPILAITQENGAIPRDEINYNVIVSNESIKNYKIVNKGDFIISLRTFQGGIEYSSFNGLCSPAYIILRKKKNIEYNDSFFIYYFKEPTFIQSLNKDLTGIRDGKIIPYSHFAKINLPFPPLKEQQKIADCLSSLDELIEAHEQKRDALMEHKKGLMQRLFPAEGENTPRWRFPEFRKAEEWEEKSLGEICKTFSGGTPSTSNKAYYGGSIPFIRSAEINNTKTELFLTELGLENSSAKLVEEGDILLALYGANSGEVAISKMSGAINQAILCLRSTQNNFFIFHYLFFKKDYFISKYLQGGQGNFSAEIVKAISIPLPALPEQQKIADCLSSLDARIEAEEAEIASLRVHKQGLMQQLFPQNL